MDERLRCNASESLEPPSVQKLAQLSHIEVSDEEAADWEPKIRGIVDWFGQLAQVDLENVQPALRGATADKLREDAPVECDVREELLAQSSERDDNFIRVPKISTGADTS